jgi:hypothetical protein
MITLIAPESMFWGNPFNPTGSASTPFIYLR